MNNAIGYFYNWYKATLRNTKYRWILVLGTLIYLVSPIDIAPDFLPIIGWIDDGLLTTLLVTEMSQIAMEYLKKRKPSAASKADDAVGVDPVTTINA
ncbi:MAG TPA: YkvA family protein [Nodosilinea sp.]|nr:YkvA family protein [Nodosilinea sp.]